MKSYDWIVVGGGITGSLLAYHLVRQPSRVLWLEKDVSLRGASRYSYGGFSYWAAKTPLQQTLAQRSFDRYFELQDELPENFRLRLLDLVMPILPGWDPQQVLAMHADMRIPPQLIDVPSACQLEPLLNPTAFDAALTVQHGHLHPGRLVKALQAAFQALGGDVIIQPVTGFLGQPSISGVTTPTHTYSGSQVIVCAGGWSRQLVNQTGLSIPLYFTHAESIEIPPPPDLHLRALVNPIPLKRFDLEAESCRPEKIGLWAAAGHEAAPPILDVGAVPFGEEGIRIGQVSRTLTDPEARVDPVSSEAAMRQGLRPYLPSLADLPGQWYECLVAFTADQLPLVGSLQPGLSIFSGFSNPLATVPALAERFATHLTAGTVDRDPLLAPLSPSRFGKG
ncbi:MAG: FAD-binding oxidoreductase [Cyanobacteriota bacterium]|nr:FAD-binding oxidoreductase [Cyanobacteriota bacterium]